MLKTRFFIAAFVLAAVFLVSAQVRAATIPPTGSTYAEFRFYLVNELNGGFDEKSDVEPDGSINPQGGVQDQLRLYAWDAENNGQKGVNFTFTSTWLGGGGEGGSGYIWNASHSGPSAQNSAYLYNYKPSIVTGSDPDGVVTVERGGILPVRSHFGVQDFSSSFEGSSVWGATFFADYGSGYGWDDFVKLLDDDGTPFTFEITIAEDNKSPYNTETFRTYPGNVLENAPGTTPEPATLLILGGGLAGLGIAARRRKK